METKRPIRLEEKDGRRKEAEIKAPYMVWTPDQQDFPIGLGVRARIYAEADKTGGEECMILVQSVEAKSNKYARALRNLFGRRKEDAEAGSVVKKYYVIPLSELTIQQEGINHNSQWVMPGGAMPNFSKEKITNYREIKITEGRL